MSGSLRDEIVRLELLLAAHPEGRVSIHLADAYRKAGDVKRALETVERGLQRFGADAAANLVHARVLLALDERERAKLALRRVLELDPENEEALRSLSGLLREAGRAAPQAAAPQAAAPQATSPQAPAAAGLAPAAPALRSVPSTGPRSRRPISGYLASVLSYPEKGVRADAPTRVGSPAPPWTAGARAPEAALPGADDAAAAPPAPLALVDLLVGLLEFRDPFFRGGSSLTRLIATGIGKEMGLEEEELERLALAALLRDLGRLALGGRLAAPRAELAPEARRRIEDHVELAIQLLEGIDLPPGVRSAVRYHHERWDGAGYPDGLRGEEIPLAARIVAVADSLAAIISPRPYRPPKRLAVAVEELKAETGTLYDPAVVEALGRVLAAYERHNAPVMLRHHILLVHPDTPRATVLAAKLGCYGYLAEATQDLTSARDRLRRVPIAGLMLSGDLADDALQAFLRDLRADEAIAALPVVVLDADAVERRIALLDRGADVCLSRETGFAELRATLGALVRRAAPRPAPGPQPEAARNARSPWFALQGELEDFPLSWLLQVLTYDGRSAAIAVQGRDNRGVVYLEQGAARHARTLHTRGEEALREMLKWSGGSFLVRPDLRTHERTIDRPLMHLLLDQAVDDDHSSPIFGAVQPD